MRAVLAVLCCLVALASSSDYVMPEEEVNELRNVRLLEKLVENNDVDELQGLLGDDYNRLLGDLGLVDAEDETVILGGETDPDHTRPILGGETDPDHTRPILGGETDPDHTRPILGGETDPDHERESLLTPDGEFDTSADYPGKFGRRVHPRAADIQPKHGNDPAKRSPQDGEDTPLDVDPCGESRFPAPQPLEDICGNYPFDQFDGTLKEGRAQCPEFEVEEVENSCGFELRKYKPGVWAFTGLDLNKKRAEAAFCAYGKILSYFEGDNEKEEQLDLTLPVSSYYVMKNMVPQQAYLAMYLAGSETNSDNPEPSAESEVVLRNEEVRFYVRAFGGVRPSLDDYKREFKLLMTAIQNTQHAAVWNVPFIHEYNGPRDQEKRHEVAFLAADKNL